MSASPGFRFLRPYLCKDVSVSKQHAYLRFFSTSKCCQAQASRSTTAEKVNSRMGHDGKGEDALRHNTNERIAKLVAANSLKWPRLEKQDEVLTMTKFQEKYANLQAGATSEAANTFDIALETLNGKVMSVRQAGSKLLFMDIYQDGQYVQGVCNYSDLENFGSTTLRQFKDFCKTVQRGDFISITGKPYCAKTSKGELSLMCRELPKLLSPSISLLPRSLEDPEVLTRNRHVDMLINLRAADTIRVRSHIIQSIRNFLIDDQFLEVQTPIIADSAGGAIARPFTTTATEFSEKRLALRVAPEIWLKRLIIGGLDRVFEIGPAFRNEGLDATHNPEFTTCEFYKAFATLEDLMVMTENMIRGIAKVVSVQRDYPSKSLPEPDTKLSETPYRRIEFIPALETALKQNLPDLSKDSARAEVLALCAKHNISISESLTLPRILDKLASIFIEPQCTEPTYIIHHPACMAPLAKSFLDGKTQQLVSARAELFIQNREMANMYEEENSPLEQRRKFMQQAKHKDEENKAHIDESYLEALEWGLPPTGGWGCGIDRMVMLFSGASRISDVLSFGSLRNVVNLANPAPRATAVAKKLEALAWSAGDNELQPVTRPSKKKKKQKKKERLPSSEASITLSRQATPQAEAKDIKSDEMAVGQNVQELNLSSISENAIASDEKIVSGLGPDQSSEGRKVSGQM